MKDDKLPPAGKRARAKGYRNLAAKCRADAARLIERAEALEARAAALEAPEEPGAEGQSG